MIDSSGMLKVDQCVMDVGKWGIFDGNVLLVKIIGRIFKSASYCGPSLKGPSIPLRETIAGTYPLVEIQFGGAPIQFLVNTGSQVTTL